MKKLKFVLVATLLSFSAGGWAASAPSNPLTQTHQKPAIIQVTCVYPSPGGYQYYEGCVQGFVAPAPYPPPPPVYGEAPQEGPVVNEQHEGTFAVPTPDGGANIIERSQVDRLVGHAYPPIIEHWTVTTTTTTRYYSHPYLPRPCPYYYGCTPFQPQSYEVPTDSSIQNFAQPVTLKTGGTNVDVRCPRPIAEGRIQPISAQFYADRNSLVCNYKKDQSPLSLVLTPEN